MQIHTQHTQATTDVRGYLGLLWRRRWWIIAPMLVIAVLALLNALRQDDRYRASAAMLLSTPPQVGDRPLSDSADRQVSNKVQRLNNNNLRTEVQEVLGRATSVTATNNGEDDVGVLTASGEDADQVAADVNDFLQTHAAIRRREVTADIAIARCDIERQRAERQNQLSRLRSGTRVPEVVSVPNRVQGGGPDGYDNYGRYYAAAEDDKGRSS